MNFNCFAAAMCMLPVTNQRDSFDDTFQQPCVFHGCVYLSLLLQTPDWHSCPPLSILQTSAMAAPGGILAQPTASSRLPPVLPTHLSVPVTLRMPVTPAPRAAHTHTFSPALTPHLPVPVPSGITPAPLAAGAMSAPLSTRHSSGRAKPIASA